MSNRMDDSNTYGTDNTRTGKYGDDDTYNRDSSNTGNEFKSSILGGNDYNPDRDTRGNFDRNDDNTNTMGGNRTGGISDSGTAFNRGGNDLDNDNSTRNRDTYGSGNTGFGRQDDTIGSTNTRRDDFDSTRRDDVALTGTRTDKTGMQRDDFASEGTRNDNTGMDFDNTTTTGARGTRNTYNDDNTTGRTNQGTYGLTGRAGGDGGLGEREEYGRNRTDDNTTSSYDRNRTTGEYGSSGTNTGYGRGNDNISDSTSTGKVGMGDKVKGTMEQMTGKLTGNVEKQQRGVERKTGQLDDYNNDETENY